MASWFIRLAATLLFAKEDRAMLLLGSAVGVNATIPNDRIVRWGISHPHQITPIRVSA